MQTLLAFTDALERTVQLKPGPKIECSGEQSSPFLQRIVLRSDSPAFFKSLTAALLKLSRECERAGYIILNLSSLAVDIATNGVNMTFYLRKIP